MKFNIYFTVRGPTGKQIEAPNTTNPVEAEDLRQTLTTIAAALPESFFTARVVGIRIEEESE